MLRPIPVLMSCLTVALATASASATSYVVDQSIGSVGSVTGTIDTDGALGILSSSDFTGWNLVVTGLGASTTLTDSNSSVFVEGNSVTATASDILFDYSNPVSSFLLFQVSFGSGSQYWCNASALGVCSQGATATPVYTFDGTKQDEARTGTLSIASAGATSAVPEPAAWAMMIGGLGAVGAVVRGRRSRRQDLGVSFA